VDPVAYYVALALLGVGAAYHLATGAKLRPTLSAVSRRIAILSFGVVIACGCLLVAVMAISPQNPVPHHLRVATAPGAVLKK
jgi:hypothetical protein